MRVLLLTAVVTLAAAPAASASAPDHGCGGLEPTGPQQIRAAHVSCAGARRVARAHDQESHAGGPCDLRRATCGVHGYTCSRSFFGDSGTRVRCTRGARVVGFVYGS